MYKHAITLPYCKVSAPSNLLPRDDDLAIMRVRGDMEAIQDPHARIRHRGCQLDTRTLSKEDGDEQTHFDHDEMGGDAGPRAGGERLEFVLNQGFAL